MNRRLPYIAIALTAGAAAAGLFASASNSAPTRAAALRPPNVCSYGHRGPGSFCTVFLTATGPSPSRLTKAAGVTLDFVNKDSVPHTVVFANGLCSLTIKSGHQGGTQFAPCDNFPFYAGSYPYTMDGKFHGTVVTTPLRRTVTLAARTMTLGAPTHAIRGTRMILHGHVSWHNDSPFMFDRYPFRVIVLARHDGRHPFDPVATVRVRFGRGTGTNLGWIRYRWSLKVQPGETTTYIARVTTQRLCLRPVSRCAHPHGQVWTNATSRPWTLMRVRH